MSIKPALTPEEWTRDPQVVRDGFDFNWIADRVPWISIGIEGEELGYALNPETFHALAALCLKDQPFGFTHLTAHSMRIAARELRKIAAPVGSLHAFWDVIFQLEEDSERIAALLPPEAK